ncbi:MAG: NAD(P)/FAD-dependent oxidoreductase [Acidobacteria bacterium]|nr:NAD(P)/FAD-dependent oxidoreductase [Acidobacteriota bacterium]
MVTDVTIVGAGPAGSTLAIALARQGVRVTLYERSKTPRLKACGEGMLPHGVAALRELIGVPEGPRMRGLRFVAGDVSVEADFPEGFGVVVRRDRFDGWLRDAAASTPNVDLRSGTAYRPLGERLVVGADGRRSMFHRTLGAVPSFPRRVGLSTHFAGIEGLGDRVEVFFHPDGELYLAPTGGGEALVSALFYQSAFRRDGIVYLLNAIPELRARASHIEQTTPLLACAPLGLRVPRIVGEGVLLIGDAAGAPDPITGDGIAMAVVSVKPAAEAILSGDFQAYERIRLDMGRNADRLGRLLLKIPRANGRTARMLLRRRALVPTLLDVAVGRRAMNARTVLRAMCSR